MKKEPNLYTVYPPYMQPCVSKHSSLTDTEAEDMEADVPHWSVPVYDNCMHGISAPTVAESGAVSQCCCAAHFHCLKATAMAAKNTGKPRHFNSVKA